MKGKYHRYIGNFEDYTFSFDILAKEGSPEDNTLGRLFRSNRRKYLNEK